MMKPMKLCLNKSFPIVKSAKINGQETLNIEIYLTRIKLGIFQFEKAFYFTKQRLWVTTVFHSQIY